MKTYYDTGILLKLYTAEPESPQVQKFAYDQGKRLYITELHLTECISALRLKVFRGECDAGRVSAALALIKGDIETGVLTKVDLEWNEVWSLCRNMADMYASTTGARTLDTLHVASARVLGAVELVTSDKRQSKLAQLQGLSVTDPTIPFCQLPSQTKKDSTR